jgi:hypothetical protein
MQLKLLKAIHNTFIVSKMHIYISSFHHFAIDPQFHVKSEYST